jgi:hypothetical protein
MKRSLDRLRSSSSWNGCNRTLREAEIESERGDILETVLEFNEQKFRSDNGIAGVRGTDSRRTLIDRKLLS